MADTSRVPKDGIGTLGYNTASNRINDSGWQYDNAGNLIRGKNTSSTWQKFEYDAAGRLVKIKDDSNNVLETYTYGVNRHRLMSEVSTYRTYYVWNNDLPIQEYIEVAPTNTPQFSKDYIYAGVRLLSSSESTFTGTQTEFYHPDRLGTKLVTNPMANSYFEQSTLPFGTALLAESTGFTNQTFTSYDRSSTTGLDYAVNRIHSWGQGRFTQIDPIEMGAANSKTPQSLNLYAYVQNRPTDAVDPSGLLMADASEGDGYCIRYHYTNGITGYWGPWTCYPGTGVGGGIGGGTGSNGNSKIAQDCIDALTDLGIWDKVKDLMASPPIVDLDTSLGKRGDNWSYTMGDELSGYEYLGNRSDGTVGEFFDYMGFDALTIRGDTPNGGKSAIYYRSHSYDIRRDTYLLLHEVTHLAYPEQITKSINLDNALVRDLQLVKKKGESDSDAVSRFFNSHCPKNMRKDMGGS